MNREYIPSETHPLGLTPQAITDIKGLIGMGKSDEEIAIEMGYKPATIATVRRGHRASDDGAGYIPTEAEIWGPLRAKRVAAGMPDVAHLDEIEE